MKIYGVYEGEIVEADVLKETNCYYWIKEHQEFYYFSRVDKQDACLTPMEAIQKAFNSRITMRGTLKDKLATIESEIANLVWLEHEYNNALDHDGKNR